MSSKIKNKRSQITIFIIIALIIIVSIALLWVFINKDREGEKRISAIKDPIGYIRQCVTPYVEDSLKLIISQGGFIDPKNYVLYNKTKIEFLCYTEEEKQLCINKHPILNKEIENNLVENIKSGVESCFENLGDELDDYRSEDLSLDAEINLEGIKIIINKKIYYTIKENQMTLSNFNMIIKNRLYDFTRITNDVVSQEVSCLCGVDTCNADLINLNKFNRDFVITRFIGGSGEEVYTIREILTGDKFNVALRNCI